MVASVIFALTSCASDNSGEKHIAKDKKPKAESPQEKIYVNGIDESNNKNAKGPIHLHGRINPGSQNGYMLLWETEGKETYILDSVQVVNGVFDFGNKEYELGFYALSYRQANNSMGIILNPKEEDVELNFTAGRLSNAPTSVNSDENKGWFIYAPQEIAHFNKIKSLRKSLKNPAMKAKTEKMMAAEDEKLEQLQRDLIKQFPGTFLAKVMTWKQTKWHDDKSRYWDDIDFTDESIIRTPIINDRIQDYMRTHSGGSETGFLNAIDLIYQKSSVNPKVNAYCTLTLLEGFYSSKREDMCLYIMDSYIYGENCGEGDAASL